MKGSELSKFKRRIMSAEFKYDIQLRDDRIGKYFRKYLNRFIFAEFSEDFINKS